MLQLPLLPLLFMSISMIHAEPATRPSPGTLRVMSFNIRFDNPRDGEHAWPNRRPMVRELLSFYQPDVLGVQEALEHQVEQVAEDLPGFEWVGVGRNDGKSAGEFAPIFYNTDRLALLDHGTFWLSPTPQEVGSLGWDAAFPRIATWARFGDKRADAEFLAVNTHFDHQGQEARTHSARLIVEQARELAGDLPIVIAGDFNTKPDTEAYAILTGAFADTRSAVETPLGPEGTFSTFTTANPAGGPIDYIFVSESFEVERAGTLSPHWDGRHASDHFPVVADVVPSE